MTDIADSKDIQRLVDAFYDKVKKDHVIGFIFNDIIGGDWSYHLPVMYSFWNAILLNTAGYTGNPVKTHIDIDKLVKLTPIHFDRWLRLWQETVAHMFEGTRAREAVKRGKLMAELMQIKIDMARNGKTIM